MANTSGKTRNGRPPYQPWYESDFWTLRVRQLHPMARLLYRALLLSAWDLEMPGHIKNDVPTIMAMSDCPDKNTWERHGKAVMSMFELSDDGTTYTNQRQMDELAKYYAKQSSWSDRGKRGNEVRWQGKSQKTKGNKSNSELQGSQPIAKGSQKDALAINKDRSAAIANHRNQTIPDHTNPNQEKNYSSEVNSEPAVILLPLNDNSEYPVMQKAINEWKPLYPAVDVLQELRKMRGWLLGSPKRRKTAGGVGKFINAWLARAQDEPKSAAKFQPEAPRGRDAAADLDAQLGVKSQ